MSQEHLSNLFKELVAGTTVLPIGVVNAEPGAFPVAHAPALLDAESNLCHACDQLASRKVMSSTKSATLVKPDESNEASGHWDIQKVVTCSQLSWFDVKTAFEQSEGRDTPRPTCLDSRLCTRS